MTTCEQPRQSLLSLFGQFLRFGLLAWGGPVAQIAMIKRELVDEQQWVDAPRFHRLLAVYQVLPGPEAHELCVHLGMVRRGRIGGLLAGLGFMLPGLILMLALSWIYGQLDLRQQPFAALFLGVQVGVIALIIRAVHRIGGHILENRWLWGIAIACAVAGLSGVGFWITLPAAGLAYALLGARRYWPAGAVIAVATLAAVVSARAHAENAPSPDYASVIAAGSVAALPLFLSGLKAGLLTFGGAYTAIPFVRGDAVARGWLSDATFLDGLALSQVIPAPLIIFATFVGFQAGGLAGALAMTAGIFLPAFAFTLLLFDRLEAVVEDRRLHHFLLGVAAGVVGLIVSTTFELGAAVARGVPSIAVAAIIILVSLVILYRWRLKYSVPGVILLSGVAGLIALR